MANLTETEMSKLLNLSVEIKLTNKIDPYIGLVYSIIPKSSLLVILTAHEDNTIAYHLLNTAYIESITLSDKKFNIDLREIMNPSLEKLLDNEQKLIEKEVLLKRSNKDNFSHKTYQKGYMIYEKFSKFYKCRYEGNRIILEELDAYLDVPFNKDDLFCENEFTKKRLVKMIEGCLNGSNNK